MRRKDHVAIDQLIFGRGYDEVHEWIDSDAKNWFGTEHSPYNHWVKNHHVAAIDIEIGVGSIEAKVAKLHVLCDWLYHFGEWHLPVKVTQVAYLLRSKGVNII